MAKLKVRDNNEWKNIAQLGENIYLPLTAGTNSPLTGDLYIADGHQIIGGRPLNRSIITTSTTAAALSWTTLKEVTDLPYGTYDVSCGLAFQSSTAGRLFTDMGSGERSYWDTRDYPAGSPCCVAYTVPIIINAQNPTIFLKVRPTTAGDVLNFMFSYKRFD